MNLHIFARKEQRCRRLFVAKAKIERSKRYIIPPEVLPFMALLFVLGCNTPTPTNDDRCTSGQTDCSGVCVELNSNAAHCGACNNACNAHQMCADGVCVLDCPSGQTDCSGTCIDTRKDVDNCGACGTTCAAGEVCSNGSCALSCQANLKDCSGSCVDTDNDRDNCGACGKACVDGEVCSNGSCALTCQSGLADCNGTCANLATDIANCGMCGTKCDAGEVCSNGVCELSCQSGLTDCNGTCANLATDIANCGACGKTCGAGEVCSNGQCALSCQAGLQDCNGSCVDLDSNPAHCGACGNACAADAVCSNGTCLGTTPVDLQFLSISDWHGQVDPLNVNNVEYGGAAVLSAYFKNERQTNPNTVTVTAGDAFGASPPLAAFFDEEPAVKALNLMGLDIDSLGNHNFDKGVMHLQTMVNLSTYKYVSSNLNNLAANVTGIESPYYLVDISGVRVAFIGITNSDAPSVLPPGSLGTITVANEITSAMAAKNAAQAAGAKVFIALVHQGATLCNAMTLKCSGPLIDIAKGLTGFNIVFGDHTDIEVNEVINGAHVVENKSKGRTYARVGLKVIPYTGYVVNSSVNIIQALKSGVTPDPAIEAMLQPYRMQLAAQLDGVIGVATAVFPRGSNIERLGEVAIGNLTADSMRIKYNTQLALVNGGGIRQPLPSSYLPADTMLRRTSGGYAAGPPYDLVVGDAHAVFPFGNAVVTRTVTGTQLWAALEWGIGAMPAANGRFPQISGFGFTYSLSAPVGSRVTEVHLTGGTPILNNSTTYTLALSDFTNNGGDGYTMLADGQGVSRDLQADVLAEHIQNLMMLTPTIEGRIVQIP